MQSQKTIYNKRNDEKMGVRDSCLCSYMNEKSLLFYLFISDVQDLQLLKFYSILVRLFFWALIFLWSKAFTTVKINRIKAYFIEESSNEWKAFNIQFEALPMVKFIVGNDEQEVMTHDFYFTIEIYVPVESSK